MSSGGRLKKMVQRGRERDRIREEWENEMRRQIAKKEDVKREDVLVHGYFVYECEECGTTYKMWLEKGLEDPVQDEKEPEKHKPVPFCIRCGNCGGTCKHILWGYGDSRKYELLPEGESYFANDPEENCGKPVRRKSFRDWKKFMQDCVLERQRGRFA